MSRRTARQALDDHNRQKKREALYNLAPVWEQHLTSILWRYARDSTPARRRERADTLKALVIDRYPRKALEAAYRLAGRTALEAMVKDALKSPPLPTHPTRPPPGPP